MKRIRYSKYVPDPAGEMSLEDLLGALSDYLLESGFQNYMFYEMPEGEQSLDALRRAIEQALLDSDLFDESMRERLKQMQDQIYNILSSRSGKPLRQIIREFQPLLRELGFEYFQSIPLSALYGDNVAQRSAAGLTA